MSGWAGWREADLSQLGATPVSSPRRGQNKYNAKKATVDGQRFDSSHEAKVWQELKCEETAGQITDLRRQRVFPLIVIGKDRLPTLIGRYTPDFVYFRGGRLEVVDAKSRATKTEAYQLRRKLFECLYGVPIREL